MVPAPTPRPTGPDVPTGKAPPWIVPRSLYAHIPFCAKHCGYCDFAIAVGRTDRMDEYLEALSRELVRKVPDRDAPLPMQTWFVGGGTPSLFSASQLQRLGQILAQRTPLIPAGEASLEANPESFDQEKADVLAHAGFNRISLGVQAFAPDTLTALERPHDASLVARGVQAARKAGLAVSLDLIFGAPGQTRESWARDLSQALELEPDHLSLYGLTYEKGTPLEKKVRGGLVLPLAEDLERDLYDQAMDTLEKAGYPQYEISNFSKPGFQSSHNRAYWANMAHLGIGMGAAGLVRGVRTLNTRDLDRYLRLALAGEDTAFQSETLTPLETARETLMLNLRRVEGAMEQEFLERTGMTLTVVLGQAADPLVASGLLERDSRGLRLTREGRFVADAVIVKLLAGAPGEVENSG